MCQHVYGAAHRPPCGDGCHFKREVPLTDPTPYAPGGDAWDLPSPPTQASVIDADATFSDPLTPTQLDGIDAAVKAYKGRGMHWYNATYNTMEALIRDLKRERAEK